MNGLLDQKAPLGMTWVQVFLFFCIAVLGSAAGRFILSKVGKLA